MSNRHFYLLVLAITLFGLSIFGYKTLFLSFPLSPSSISDRWQLEVHISFLGQKEPVKASLYVPSVTGPFTLVDEGFASQRFGLTTNKKGPNRQIVWSARKAEGIQHLYYRGSIRPAKLDSTASRKLKQPKIEKTPYSGAHLVAVDSLISEIKESSADMETMVAQLLKRLAEPGADQNVALLLNGKPSFKQKLKAVTEILAHADIAARVVQGIRLQESGRDVSRLQWLEIYEDGTWQAYDPVSGLKGIPGDYFAWWRGDNPLVHVSGAKKVRVTTSLVLDREEALNAATLAGKKAPSILQAFSLFSLPIDTQEVFRILLMVPLGIVLLVVLRNVVGVKMFGTFMPALIAMAFRETQLLWGIVLFSLIICLGLAVRFYLDRLKLLLVPRLAAILIMVIFLMAVLSIVTYKLDIQYGLSISIFPIVIVTMTIERMSIIWEEQGATEAIQQGIGSMAVAALAYWVMNIAFLEHLFFVFPELTMLLLAAVLLLGRYSGFRLFELARFRELAKEGN